MPKKSATTKSRSPKKVTKTKNAQSRKPTASAQKSSAPMTGPRRLRPPKYRSFQYSKRIKHPVKLPGAFWLLRKAVRTLWQAKWLFAGILFWYALLSLVLVQAVGSAGDTTTLKDSLSSIFSGNFAGVLSSLTVFSVLLASAGSTNSSTGSVYEILLGIIFSLIIIWSLRQVTAGIKIRIRDALYQSTYPLVQFSLVIVVILLQLIPLLLGVTVYNYVVNGGIAVLTIEKVIWALLCAMLALLTIYMLCSSLFALYIVALPNMTPMKALRSARQLVRFRRWTVMRKVLFLPLALLVLMAIIMVPIILFATSAATVAFFILSMLSLFVAHCYLYSLYRELLTE